MKVGVAARLAAVESRIGYEFADIDLLRTALTHASAMAGRRMPPFDTYERLEFLGDRVLGLVVAEMLLDAYPTANEGDIARRFNDMVRNEACAETALALDLGPAILMGGSEAQSGGRQKSTILGDVCEALIGAIYLDGGLEPAARFVRDNWGRRMASWRARRLDAKTALQEWAQGNGYGTPTYEIVGKSGPDHEPRFEVVVSIDSIPPGRGDGGARRDAEQNAAAAVLVREGVWKEQE